MRKGVEKKRGKKESHDSLLDDSRRQSNNIKVVGYLTLYLTSGNQKYFWLPCEKTNQSSEGSGNSTIKKKKKKTQSILIFALCVYHEKLGHG